MKRRFPENKVIYSLVLWILLSFMGLFAQTAIGTNIENIAYAHYRDPGGFEYNIQSQAVITTVSQGYKLSISKSVETSVYMPLDTVVYHIEIQNSGNIAVSSINVMDTLSNDLTYLSSQPAGTVNDQNISWIIQNIQPGASSSIDLQCLVASGFVSGKSIENMASFSTVENVMGYSQPIEIVVDSRPDLQIEANVNYLSAYAGDTLIYSISFHNSGNASANQTILYHDLSFQTDFISCSGGGQFDKGIVTWAKGSIPAGDTVSETVIAVVKSEVSPGALLISTSTVSCSEGFSASAQVVSQIIERVQQADIWIQKTSIPYANPGDTLSYHISYGNIGNCPATEIVLRDSLSALVAFESASGAVQYDPLTHVIRWVLSDIPENAKDSVEVKVIVQKGIADGTILESRAQISCKEGLSAHVMSLTSILSPQLTFVKTTDSLLISAGNEIDYRISYKNTGNGAATGVMITDTLSEHIIYVSSNGSSVYDSDHHTVIWNVGDMIANMSEAESLELKVRTSVPLNDGTVIINSAEIKCNEGFSKISSVNSTVNAEAVLLLSKSTQLRAFRGDTLTYVLSFRNEGNSIAAFTRLTDTLTSDVEFITAEGQFTYNAEHHCINWNIGDVYPGVDSSLFLKVRIPSLAEDVVNIHNTAWVHSGDIHLMSNMAITTLNNLNITITADPDTIIGNGINHTKITVNAMQATGQPASDGTVIVLSATQGSFSPGTDTVTTLNGIAQTDLISSKIYQEYVSVKVKANLQNASGISDSTDVVFSALRIVGIVTDGDNLPVGGAIVTVLQDGIVIGSDTTGTEGIYSIAVYTSGRYIIRIQYPDGYGNYSTIEKELDVDVENPDESNTIEDKCSISGRLIDYNTQEPINIPDISIIIQSSDPSTLAKSTDESFMDTTYTDSSGFWIFKDLDPGTYSIETINDDDDVYHVGNRSVVIGSAGQNIINFNIIQRPVIFRIYKTVDRTQALNGDTLSYKIVYSTTNNTVTDTIRIIDPLPSELEWIPSSLNYSGDIVSYEFEEIGNQITFYLNGLLGNELDSIQFNAKVRDEGISMITNEAMIMGKPDTAYTADNEKTHSQTMIISPFLYMTKSVNWPVAEAGDILTYTLKLENRSQDQILYGMSISDILPRGFKYKEGRSSIDTHVISDPLITVQGLRQTLKWTLSDTLTPGSTLKLKYRVIIGLESHIGKNENIAYAIGSMYDGYLVSSNVANADVVIKPGMIHDRGLIFGKVYFDQNSNNMHDQNERTVKGVEIITEEGIRVITDEFGKYSIPNVTLGDHVLRINEKTLPENTEVKLSSSDFLGDTHSRLVKVSYSGIAKANFVLGNADDIEKTEGRNFAKIAKIKTKKIVTYNAKTKKSEGNTRISGELLTFTLEEALFDIGSAKLKPAAMPLINKLGDLLKRQGDISIDVEGFTDNVGSNMLNKIISLNRAKSVKEYLISNYSISSERIVSIGHGKAFPISDNSTAIGRSLNRRVEITIKSQKFKKVSRKVAKLINAIQEEVEKTNSEGVEIKNNTKRK
jgi:uncharacterized repeat protein (TIGR01451 family)